jgi:hypothetical protein
MKDMGKHWLDYDIETLRSEAQGLYDIPLFDFGKDPDNVNRLNAVQDAIEEMGYEATENSPFYEQVQLKREMRQ